MKDNLKITLPKLYNFITKLADTLEDELDDINNKGSNDTINTKKGITEALNKLVHLIIRLNKLSKDESLNEKVIMSEEDIEIINNFLTKYK